MTNTEAITKLTNIMHDDHYSWHPSILTAFSMAVDALKGAEGDCVSRQAVLSLPRNTTRNFFGEIVEESISVADIERLPSVQPEPQWIPVTERLPEEKINPNTQDYDWVLCSTTFGDVRAYHFGRGRFLHGCGDVTQYVTAWMPLPEPWKEGEADADD